MPYIPPTTIATDTIPAHLRAVPTPLSTHPDGIAWIPRGALRALRQREEARAARAEGRVERDAPIDAAGERAAVETWTQYLNALKRADIDAANASPAIQDAAPGAMTYEVKGHALGRALDLILTQYNRARLGAYTAALGDEGRTLFRIQRADAAFAHALARKTRGALTPDLCPDLPRRLDLTDAADDAVRDLERGRITWMRLKRRLESPARAAVREALDDMGWNFGRGD